MSGDPLTGSDDIELHSDAAIQRLAGEALTASELRYRRLFETAKDGILILDAATGMVVDVNPFLINLLGISREIFLGKAIWELGFFKDIVANVDNFAELQQEKYIRYDDKPLKTADGRRVDVEFVSNVYLVNNQKVIQCNIRDITERKKAKEAVLASEARLQLFVTYAPAAIAMFDNNMRYLVASRRWITDYHLGEQKIIGQSHYEVFPEITDEWKLVHQRGLAGEVVRAEEDRFVRSDGSVEWLRWEVRPWYAVDRSVGGIIIFTEDITGHKRWESELLQIEKLQSVGTLAGGIAHDFNNILMGLFGNISLCKDELPKDHPGYKPLEYAEKAMTRAVRLTKQLLTFAKGGDPIKENISLDAIVEEVARFELSGSNVLLVHQQASELWNAKADEGQIQQVISNLTINARQAMPHGGHLYITLENAEIQENAIPTLHQGKYIKVTVRDEGTGIDPACMHRIFEPYYSTKQTGNGLGLATTYSIISKHGGHIEVASEPGKGTTFTFYLPASESSSRPAMPSVAEPVILKPATKILILDDEEYIRMVTPHWLKRLGCLVETAADGQQAIEMYKQAMNSGAPFDVMILDLTIPGGIGGQEVLKEIQAIDPHAKAIVSSGYAEDTVMSNYVSWGFKGILAKPYSESQLGALVKQVVR